MRIPNRIGKAILLVIVLLTPYFIPTIFSLKSGPPESSAYREAIRGLLQGSPSSGIPKGVSRAAGLNGLKQAADGKLFNVTLITGDRVLAWMADNGTILPIAIELANSTRLGQNFHIIKMRNSTYVIPGNIDIRKFDLELFNLDLLIREGYEKLPYIPIIVEHPSGDVNVLIGQLEASKEKVTHRFSIIPAFAVKLPKDGAGKLSELLIHSRDVRKIWLDRKVHSRLNESALLIGAPDAWALGLNGTGIRIAIIDTGIDAGHADFFFPNGTSKIERAVSFVDYDGDGIPEEPPDDYFGHGTHVASIAAGTGAKSAGKFKGIAYGAKLWNVKVLNRWGWGYLSWVIAGVEYATLGPDYTPNTGDEADILSLSLGAYWWTDGTDPLSMACDAAVDLGRVVVVAAGNWGDYFGIGVPATARKVITVGATNKQDTLAWFSSRGPTIDFRVKPDVVAPGVDVWAACAKGSLIEYWANQTWIPGEDVDGDGRYDYVQLSGTSMSTPHVSGFVAILKELIGMFRQSYSDMPDTPTVVKDILISTANDLGYDVYTQGGGRINVTSAIDVPVLIDPATISFGMITEDKLINSTIVMHYKPITSRIVPLDGNITLRLSVTVRDVVTGSLMDHAAALNASTLTIPFNGSRAVLLTLNTTVPASLYEGRITVEVVDGPWVNRTMHAIFGFVRLNNVTVTLIDRYGNPAAWAPVHIFKHNATSYLDLRLSSRLGWTDESGRVRFYVGDGNFSVVGCTRYGDSDVWTIAHLPITGNIELTLDGRLAGEVSFDPAKPNQVFASKRTSVSWWEPGLWDFQWTSLWYYPATALTYMTNTFLRASFSYEYYNMEYFNVAYPSIIDAPEWHNLIYWEDGVTPPVTYVADYSSLVRRATEYRVPMAPKLAAYLVQHKWSPFEVVSSEIDWVINVPRERVEWLTPGVYYQTFYWKYRDPPWTSTPYWFFAHWPFLKEYYPPSARITEAFGGHPLSTHFHVYADPYYLYMVTDIFMDTYGHTLWWVDKGHMRVYRDDSLIFDGDIWDAQRYWWGDPRPARYRVVIDGWSEQCLSTTLHTELEFTVVNEAEDYAPPTLHIMVPGLDLNNTHAAGEVIVYVYVDDPRYSSEANVTVEYSVDDGITWNNATPLARPVYAGAPYPFYLGVLNDTYVSLRVNATDLAGNKISQTTIRGFYVRPYVVITVGPPGSGAKYTSIREAVQAAPPYSKIMVFPGTYSEGTITVDKPLSISSTGGMKVTIVKNSTFKVVAKDVDISGLTLSEGSIGVSAFGVNSLILKNCNITKNTVGLLIIDSSVKVMGTEISWNTREGVAIYGSSDVWLRNSSVHNNGLPPSIAPAILLVGPSKLYLGESTIYNNTWGILQYDSSSSIINGSEVMRNNVGIVLLKSSSASLAHSHLYDNLWALITYDSSSLTVENSTIHHNIYEGIVGYGSSRVLLSFSSINNNGFNGVSMYDSSTLKGTNSNISSNIVGIILLNNSTAHVSNFTIYNNTWGVLGYGATTFRIENSIVSNNNYEGVVGFDSALIVLRGSLIVNNTYNGILMSGNSSLKVLDSQIQGNGAAGVFLSGSSSMLMNNSYIRGNNWGIIGYGNPLLQIESSSISCNVHEGVVLYQWSVLKVTGSILANNLLGMVAYDFSKATISDSAIASNTYEGIVVYLNSSLQASHLKVTENIRGISAYYVTSVDLHYADISLNEYEGVYIGGNATVALNYSSIRLNTWGIVVGTGSYATVHVHNSSITNNVKYGVLNWGVVPVNATYNWWGDSSGPYHPLLNPTGMGDSVSDNVLFQPWLTSPPSEWEP